MPVSDILVAGEINPDLILSGDVVPAFGQWEQLIDGATLTVGSSSAILACGAARLGLRVTFVGVCGDDLFGRFMLEAMRGRGVDTSSVRVEENRQTGISVILNRGEDRAILTFLGCIPSLQAEQVSVDLLKQTRHLHVSSYFLQTVLQPDLPGLFRKALDLGLTTSLDTNWDPAQSWRGVVDVLDHTTVFLPNAAEACLIADEPDLETAAGSLAKRAKIVAVKLGASGAIGATRGKTARVPAVETKVIDTVGAGDSFDSGFLYGFLNGWALEKSLRLAVVCGSISTEAAGGTAAQPSLDQALCFL